MICQKADRKKKKTKSTNSLTLCMVKILFRSVTLALNCVNLTNFSGEITASVKDMDCVRLQLGPKQNQISTRNNEFSLPLSVCMTVIESICVA